MQRRIEEVVIFYNRRAGAGAREAAVQALCRELGKHGLRCFVESDVTAFRTLMEDWTLRGYEGGAVLAAGGDGTVGLAASLMPPSTPLAIFPLGTENLLAKHLGCPGHVPAAVERLMVAPTRVWDALQVDGRLGLLMISCGFDADVVRRLHARRVGHITHWSYAQPLWEAVREYAFHEMKVEWGTGNDDPATWHVCEPARWCFIFNAPVYAMGLPLAVGANPVDGLLDVLLMADGGFWNGMSYLTATLTGRLQALSGVRRLQASRVRISATQCVPFQIDGDPGGVLPISVELIPRRIQLWA